MGVINFFMKPLPLTIIVNSYIAFLTPLLIYFLVFKRYDPSAKSRIPLFLKEMLIILLIGWISSSWLAMYSTLDQCGSLSILWTLLIGLVTPAFMLLGFILVRYLMPFLKAPAKVLFGMIKNIILQDSLITGFYMMLCSWMGSIITHFLAVDEGCRQSRDSMKKFRADMKKRQETLESEDDEEEDKEPEMVTI